MLDVSGIDEPNEESFDFRYYLDVARRRHMLFLIALLIGWLGIWALSWILPARYKSSTLILVEEPTMPRSYVEPNVEGDMQDRLQSITQQILSRTRLLLVIDTLHLYAGERRQITPDEKVELMRKNINIELVHDAHTQQITAFRINYSGRDPQQAQQVTEKLTELVIGENLKVRREQSEGTTKFIQDQLENARVALAEQEAKVRSFQAQHEGELPGEQAANLEILSGLQSQLQSQEDALSSARQQGIYLQTLLDQDRAVRRIRHTADGVPTDIPTIDRELASLRVKLANLRTRYTDFHPDIQNTKAEIAEAERVKAGLTRDSERTHPEDELTGASGDEETVLQNASMLQLQSQLRASQADVGNRERAVVTLKGRIDKYQARLNNGPATEQQLADLARGYEQSRADYDALLKKKNDSQMATSMEQRQQGERFTMLDPPSLPQKPVFPNRMKFCGIGVGLGVLLGIAVVVVSEISNGHLHTERDIQALVGVPIICEIPEIITPSEQLIQKRSALLGWTTGAVVLGLILTGCAISYVHG